MGKDHKMEIPNKRPETIILCAFIDVSFCNWFAGQ